MQTTDDQIGYLNSLPDVYQFIIRNLPAPTLPNVFQQTKRSSAATLIQDIPLCLQYKDYTQWHVSLIKAVAVLSLQIFFKSWLKYDELLYRCRTVKEFQHLQYTVPSIARCVQQIPRISHKSIHSFCCTFPQAGEPLAYTVCYFFTQLFVHWLTQKPPSITQTFNRSLMHTQLILFTNSNKIQSLDLIHPLSQSCQRSYTHNLVHSAIRSQIHFTRSLSIRLSTQSLINSQTRSVTDIHIYSVIQSVAGSFKAFFNWSRIHSFSLLTHTDLVYLSFV